MRERDENYAGKSFASLTCEGWVERGALGLIAVVVVILLYLALCVLLPLPLPPGIADKVEIIHR